MVEVYKVNFQLILIWMFVGVLVRVSAFQSEDRRSSPLTGPFEIRYPIQLIEKHTLGNSTFSNSLDLDRLLYLAFDQF